MSLDILFTDNQKKQLFENNKKSLELNIFEPNFKPVALLFAEKLNYKFLITQLEERRPRVAFSLSDYGNGDLEFEVLDIDQLEQLVINKGDILKSTPSFEGKYNLAIYAKVADQKGQIITDDNLDDVKSLFAKLSKEERYNDPNKNVRRFRYLGIE